MDVGLEHSIKYNLLNNFKTDNLIIDLLLGSIIASLINYFFSLGDVKYIFNSFSSIFNLCHKKSYKLSLNCLETRTYYGKKLQMNGSLAFKAILFFLKTHLKKNEIPDLYRIREFCTYDDDYENISELGRDQKQKQTDMYISNQKQKFSIDNPKYNGIYFQMEKEILEKKDKDSNENICSQILYTLHIFSYTHSLSKIQNIISESKDLYLEEMSKIIHQKKFVFVYEGKRDEQPDYTVYPFQTTTNMDTLFFDQKQETLKQIDFFKNNRDWYEKRGKPYTLGICSYGLPGCGKTTFEKAVANYLNRHMIIVDFSKIKSAHEADQIFFSETINDLVIPYEKRLYVFPDIDRMCSLIHKDSNTNSDFSNPEISVEKVFNLLNDKINKEDTTNQSSVKWSKNNNNTNQKSDLSLSKLLNILDGIPERTGQVIMMSANHPEKIDPALLRPGRIDILLKFKEASYQSLIKIVENQFQFFDTQFLEKKLSEKWDNYQTILNEKWTPAEIFQICSKYSINQDGIIQALTFLINKNTSDIALK